MEVHVVNFFRIYAPDTYNGLVLLIIQDLDGLGQIETGIQMVQTTLAPSLRMTLTPIIGEIIDFAFLLIHITKLNGCTMEILVILK